MDEKRLVLMAEPTFTVPVVIPRPGREPVKVSVTFRFFETEQYAALVKEIRDAPLVELICRLVVGWDEQQVAEAFSAEALAKMCRVFPKSTRALLRAFEGELFEVAEKN